MPTRRRGKKLTILLASALLLGTVIVIVLSWKPLVAEIRFRMDFDGLGLNDQGRPEYRHRQTGIIFVYVPGGTFVMGSPEDEEGRNDDEDQHEVRLSAFLIGKYGAPGKVWERGRSRRAT